MRANAALLAASMFVSMVKFGQDREKIENAGFVRIQEGGLFKPEVWQHPESVSGQMLIDQGYYADEISRMGGARINPFQDYNLYFQQTLFGSWAPAIIPTNSGS